MTEPKIIDTHSHVNFNAFKNDSDEVTQRSLGEGIWMINVGTKYETSQSAVDFAKKHQKGVYAAVGLHPMYAAAEFIKLKTDLLETEALRRSSRGLSPEGVERPDEGEFLIREQDFNKEKYKELALSGGKKVLAIGEVGLDYYYKPKTSERLQQFKEKQKQVFIEQMDLAKELNLPLILHCRMAHDDVIGILKTRGENRGVIHCFTGTLEQAKKYVAMGFYIGINGIIFKFNIDDVIKEISLENMVVETDCPYLTPTAEAGKRNEPIFIKHTIQRIAELKNISFEEVCQKTTENAKKLFNID